MPVVDMPLEKLRVYQGTNPIPVDMDQYWDKALAEMEQVDPQVVIEKSDFQVDFAECNHLYFTGVGGARIHAKYLKPKYAKGPHPAILQFHGYSGGAGDWFDKLPYVAMGYTVVAMDCRGQGGYSEDLGGVRGTTFRGHIVRGLMDSPEKLLFRQIFLDTAQLAKIVMEFEEVDPDRVAAMGGSQGGGLTLACAALEPRIKKLVPMYPFLSDYKRVWDMDLDQNAYEELRAYFRRYDPRHEREDEIFTTLGYIDIQHLAKRIKGEVLMAITLLDNICPPSTQFAVYNKIQSKKEAAIYYDFGHEGLPEFADMALQFLKNL
ncbi:MAG: acetylxylan esterase [Epulopiscium sp.]|nr:acetylxylan esterase [Candidatus Epulonipiscium sp.]